MPQGVQPWRRVSPRIQLANSPQRNSPAPPGAAFISIPSSAKCHDFSVRHSVPPSPGREPFPWHLAPSDVLPFAAGYNGLVLPGCRVSTGQPGRGSGHSVSCRVRGRQRPLGVILVPFPVSRQRCWRRIARHCRAVITCTYGPEEPIVVGGLLSTQRPQPGNSRWRRR